MTHITPSEPIMTKHTDEELIAIAKAAYSGPYRHAEFIRVFTPEYCFLLIERARAAEALLSDSEEARNVLAAAVLERARERDAAEARARTAEEALKSAMPWAKIGFYLFDECASAYGDRHQQPEECTITWEWQQSRSDDHAFSALTADADAFLNRLAEDIETSPWLADHPIVGPHLRALTDNKGSNPSPADNAKEA